MRRTWAKPVRLVIRDVFLRKCDDFRENNLKPWMQTISTTRTRLTLNTIMSDGKCNGWKSCATFTTETFHKELFRIISFDSAKVFSLGGRAITCKISSAIRHAPGGRHDTRRQKKNIYFVETNKRGTTRRVYRIWLVRTIWTIPVKSAYFPK